MKIFDSFFAIIILKTFIFKSSVLFKTHVLLIESLNVLQLPTHLSNLTSNGYYRNSLMYSLECKLIRADRM